MRLIAYFDSPRTLERAAAEARRVGWRPLDVRAPAFHEPLLEVARATHSPVAIYALAGGLLGLVFGLLLTVGTVRQWPGLIVSGKPLVSMPPFLIIMFELTILVASIGGLASFLTASARARRAAGATADPPTTDDRFSLLLEASDADASEEWLARTGATGWRRV